MPRRHKSKKLKQLEQKLKILKQEIAKRKKLQNTTSSPSKTTKRKKAKYSPFEECQNIVDRIKKVQYARPFLEPVDWKELNIPTYPQIIKHPMDLQTVSNKLATSKYATPYEFAVDMRLIYQNASTFNKPGTTFYASAAKFAKKFEEEFEKKILDLHEHNDFTKRIGKVVTTLIKRDDAAAFRMPVDPKVLEIPDYFDIITRPMDLGTILNQIHRYRDFKTFAADLYRVWDNCCKYNPKQNAIHQTALKLREYTTKQFQRLCPSEYDVWRDHQNQSQSPELYPLSTLSMHPNVDIKPPQSTVIAPGPSVAHLQSDSDLNISNQMEPHDVNEDDIIMDNTQQHMNSNMNVSEQQDESTIFNRCDELMVTDEDAANRMMINHLMKKNELDQNTVSSLNFQQKEELQRGIQCLDSDHFDPLINMLQSFIPEGEGDDDEVELDVDAIDDPLQVKMYNYMLQAINQQEQERIEREGGDVNNMSHSPQIQSQLHPQIQHQRLTQMEVDEMQNVQQHDGNEEEQQQQEQQEVSQSVEQMEMDQSSMPNVVNAFPTNSNISNVEQVAIENDSAANYTFGPTVDSMGDPQNEQNAGHDVIESQQEMQSHPMQMQQVEDQDIDMANNEEVESHQVVDGMNGDIVSDIANVVDAENVTTVSMPRLEEENENEMDQGQIAEKMDGENNEDGTNRENDNDLTDQEIADNDQNETPQPEQPQIIPTMPALQPDDDGDDVNNGLLVDDQQNLFGNENVEQMEPGQDGKGEGNETMQQNGDIPQIESIENEIEKQIEDGEAMNVDEENEDNQEQEEEVDTPLADDIDF